MTHPERILEELRDELGFSPDLVGGRRMVLAQIERFLASAGVPEDLDPLSQPALWSRLVSEVVVPETSFFRYPESFEALREWTLKQAGRPLQILCLPCSTGEEAYSIAITLREAGLSNFHVTACDASMQAVLRAREGRYAARLTRGLSDHRRSRWFHTHEGEVEAAAALKETITFRVANILAFDATPGAFDIVFCRNLLIYFDATNQRRIFDRLGSWLRPEGLLFLGPGEATTAVNHGWQGTRHPMSFSFIRSRRERVRAVTVRRLAPASQRTSAAPKSVAGTQKPALPPSAPAELAPDIDWLARAGELADAGHLGDAAQALHRFHSEREATPASLLLHGILDEARGDRDAAETHYRKALYLDPDQIDALLHLSLLLESEGRVQAAAPFRKRIERLTAAS
jgi:chemotaxis protein methyltransferase WspC